MALSLAIAAGAAVLGLGIYLAVLLGLVRRRGFGTGRTVEVPGSDLSLQIPEWWSVETRSAEDRPGEIEPVVRIETGNHRGILEIRPLAPAAFPGSPPVAADLVSALESVLDRRRIVLDEPAVRTAAPDPGDGSPPRRAAWIASKGHRAPENESRSYFETHLVETSGRLVLLEYSNSVLHGYLDAFYIQRLLDTIRSREAPPPDETRRTPS